jgi:hypothetical protein
MKFIVDFTSYLCSISFANQPHHTGLFNTSYHKRESSSGTTGDLERTRMTSWHAPGGSRRLVADWVDTALTMPKNTKTSKHIHRLFLRRSSTAGSFPKRRQDWLEREGR